jgi:hypothetical protein
MPDPNDPTLEPIDPDPGQPTDPVDPDPGEPGEPGEPGAQDVKFNKTQLQQISSIMGSIMKKQIHETVVPMIENSSASVKPSPNLTDTSNPTIKKFNEELLEQMLSGDVTGAIEKYNKVQAQATQNLDATRQAQLNKATGALSDKPHYGEIKDEVNKHAAEAMKRGYPPEPAAEYGYTMAVNAKLQKQISGDDDGSALHLESGGRFIPTVKSKGKLPPLFEEAYQRDKAKGLFKDRKEFIANLAPQIRVEHGL